LICGKEIGGEIPLAIGSARPFAIENVERVDAGQNEWLLEQQSE